MKGKAQVQTEQIFSYHLCSDFLSNLPQLSVAGGRSLAQVACGRKGHGLGPENPQFKSGLHNERVMLTISTL